MGTQASLIFSTLFLCMSSGVMGFQGLLLVCQKGNAKFHMASMITGILAMCVSTLALLLRVEHWERLFNGFSHITSGISSELMFCVVFIVAECVALVMLRRASEEEAIPGKALGIVFVILALIGGFVCARSYDMGVHPTWNSLFLYLCYYASMLISGSFTIWALSAITRQPVELSELMGKMSLVFAVVNAAAVVATIIYIAGYTPDVLEGSMFYTYDPTRSAADPSAALSAPLSGDMMDVFWGGTVALGSVVPAIVAALACVRESFARSAVIAGFGVLCTLAGGYFLRTILYALAIASYSHFF